MKENRCKAVFSVYTPFEGPRGKTVRAASRCRIYFLLSHKRHCVAKPKAHVRLGLCSFMVLLFPVNHFPDNDLLCASEDAIHTSEPFQLIAGLEGFGHTLGSG